MDSRRAAQKFFKVNEITQDFFQSLLLLSGLGELTAWNNHVRNIFPVQVGDELHEGEFVKALKNYQVGTSENLFNVSKSHGKIFCAKGMTKSRS